MANPVIWFEIQGQNDRKLQEYYANLFGWKINADNPVNYGIVQEEKGGIGGGICSGSGPVVIYVAVDDMQAALDKAVALGGEVVTPVTNVPGMVTYAHFRDPQGNLMGIIYNDPNMK